MQAKQSKSIQPKIVVLSEDEFNEKLDQAAKAQGTASQFDVDHSIGCTMFITGEND